MIGAFRKIDFEPKVISHDEVTSFRHGNVYDMTENSTIEVDFIKDDSFDLEDFLMESIMTASDKMAKERRSKFKVV